MQSHILLSLLVSSVSAIGGYAPAPVVTPAPIAYGSPYGGIPHNTEVIQPVVGVAQPIEIDNYGVPEYLPSVAQNTNVVPAAVIETVAPQPIYPRPAVYPQQPVQNPIPVSVPVAQPVAFSQQVSVTNPQVLNQGYAPVPQVAPAPSAYGSSYGPVVQPAPVSNGYTSPVQVVPVNNNVYTQNTAPVVAPFTGSLDTWTATNTARGVRTKVAPKNHKKAPKKVKIH